MVFCYRNLSGLTQGPLETPFRNDHFYFYKKSAIRSLIGITFSLQIALSSG